MSRDGCLTSHSIRGAAALLALIVAFPSTASAQVRYELGPFVAYYRPAGTFGPTSVYSVTLPARPSDKAGPALGVRGRMWMPNRYGVEVQVARAFSTVGQVFTPAGPRGPTSVRVLSVAVLGLYEVTSTERVLLWLGAGGGLVRHGGDSYGSYGSPESVAGATGIGCDIRLRGRLSAALGLTTYVYLLDVRDSRNTLQFRFQVDPLVQVGLVWAWPGREGA